MKGVALPFQLITKNEWHADEEERRAREKKGEVFLQAGIRDPSSCGAHGSDGLGKMTAPRPLKS